MRGARVDMPVDRAVEYGLDHIGYALRLPAMRWERRCDTIVGIAKASDDAAACRAWAEALPANPTRLSRADGRVRIEISRCPDPGAALSQSRRGD